MVAILAMVLALGFVATAEPAPSLEWRQGTAPQPSLNAESVIATPTGFSILGGPGPGGGVVYSTTDGQDWLSRPLPRLSARIVYHRSGLFVVDGRQVTRIGPDVDDPTVRIEIPEAVRIGNGSKRSGLVPLLDGMLVQTVSGDFYWSDDARRFERVVDAAAWRADSDVTPSPRDLTDVAPGRVRSNCRPIARRAPDIPPLAATDDRIVILVPEHDPSVVWPACEPVPWISFDGTAWAATADVSPFPAGAFVFDLAWRDGRFVAVGGLGYDRPMAWTSTDGFTWEPIDGLRPEPDVDLVEVDAGPLGWLVMASARDGSPRTGWFSRDGACWEPIPAEVDGHGSAIGEEYVVVVDGTGGRVWVGEPTDSIAPFGRCG